MKKEETIRRCGEEEYKRRLEQTRAWVFAHREEHNVSNRNWREKNPMKAKASDKKWREANPDKLETNQHEGDRKGGKYYERTLAYNKTGLRRARSRIRQKHAHQYKPYKEIIAPDSQIHHQWIPKTAEYKGVALVEKDQHQYGIVDVIEILEGKITLLTEEEIRNGRRKIGKPL